MSKSYKPFDRLFLKLFSIDLDCCTLSANEKRDALNKALSLLDEVSSLILRDYFVHDKPRTDICETRGIYYNKVCRLYNRALCELRKPKYTILFLRGVDAYTTQQNAIQEYNDYLSYLSDVAQGKKKLNVKTQERDYLNLRSLHIEDLDIDSRIRTALRGKYTTISDILEETPSRFRELNGIGDKLFLELMDIIHNCTVNNI